MSSTAAAEESSTDERGWESGGGVAVAHKNAEQAAGRKPQKISQDKSKALLFSACENGGEVEKCVSHPPLCQCALAD